MGVDDELAELLRTSGTRLRRLAYQLCHDRSTAEDLVQDAVLRVYGSWLRRKPDIANAEAYLRRAIVNEFLGRRRVRASTELVTDEIPEHADADFADSVAARDEVWRALAGLPRRQRAVLVLRYYEALPDREIAKLIGAQEATVRSLAARGLAALRSGNLAEEAT